jgi:cellulose synthase/poly-beta-1,6-N-acetylglucosamine synthase-like glycosyltransferase/peptidoglycan/xylan/chitin deacetylase (PgdA/CDA1 family)
MTKEPRAHWVVVGLILIVLLAELCLHGYAKGAGADGPNHAAAAGPTVASVAAGGPVLRLDADSLASVRLPAKTIALTFDDGPDPTWTPQVLRVLNRFGVHATFFQIGSAVNEHPELTRAVTDQGSEVGIHTFTHPDLATLPAWRLSLEVSLTANAIAAASGRTPRLMRPPFSATPDAVTQPELAAMRQVGDMGYLVALADLDSEDWQRPGVDKIVSNSMPGSRTGDIVLMHDGGGNRAETVAALTELIPRLLHDGYRFVTVSDALGLPAPAAAGTTPRIRGQVVQIAQKAGDVIASTMSWILLIALVLGLIRLPVQIGFAAVHRRRHRRSRPRRYLGGVSVIVPAYNEAANIAATITSLRRSDYPRFEIVVVDDGSTDRTAEIVARLAGPDLRLIRQQNAGKPAALNTGIAAARYDLLVLVDGDTIFEPDALGKLIQPLVDPAVGAVAGNTKVANRRGFLGRWQHLEYVIGFNLDRRMFDLARCMPTVPGAIGAFHREVLTDVGGVSSQTLAEDTDLTMAIAQAGWRIVYQPDAIAHTEAPASLQQLWRQRYRWCYGTLQAMWKHRASVWKSGSAGTFGRRGLIYLTLFQVLLPLCAPAVDVFAIYGLIFLRPTEIIAVWCGFVALQMATAIYALRLDDEPIGSVWVLPLQQFVYRQLMYLVVVQSVVMAAIGGRLRWHRMSRNGAAARILETAQVTGRPR